VLCYGVLITQVQLRLPFQAVESNHVDVDSDGSHSNVEEGE